MRNQGFTLIKVVIVLAIEEYERLKVLDQTPLRKDMKSQRKQA